MSELQVLLKRIKPKEEKPRYREPSSEPSPALLSLLRRMEARQWREETLAAIIEYIRRTVWEVKFIQHLRKCKGCQAEAIISVERYGGRSLPWFLDLINDPVECGYVDDYADLDDPRYKDCPRVQDYRIGSYWDRSTDHNETWKFISDRMDWAEKIDRQHIVSATQFYKRLKNWDLNGQPPSEEVILCKRNGKTTQQPLLQFL